MVERRKSRRMPVSLTLEISNLYKQNNVLVNDINAPIEVTNISKTGIGFCSKSILPIGYYFNASINLGDKDTLNCVVKIIRSEATEDEKVKEYGCEFIGMATVLSYIFDEYDRRLGEDDPETE